MGASEESPRPQPCLTQARPIPGTDSRAAVGGDPAGPAVGVVARARSVGPSEGRNGDVLVSLTERPRSAERLDLLLRWRESNKQSPASRPAARNQPCALTALFAAPRWATDTSRTLLTS